MGQCLNLNLSFAYLINIFVGRRFAFGVFHHISNHHITHHIIFGYLFQKGTHHIIFIYQVNDISPVSRNGLSPNNLLPVRDHKKSNNFFFVLLLAYHTKKRWDSLSSRLSSSTLFFFQTKVYLCLFFFSYQKMNAGRMAFCLVVVVVLMGLVSGQDTTGNEQLRDAVNAALTETFTSSDWPTIISTYPRMYCPMNV
jgi:hypothetical protein